VSLLKKNEQKYIDEVMKYPFDAPDVIYGGEKSGSLSAGVLTTAIYVFIKHQQAQI